jgi:hypothetical protein
MLPAAWWWEADNATPRPEIEKSAVACHGIPDVALIGHPRAADGEVRGYVWFGTKAKGPTYILMLVRAERGAEALLKEFSQGRGGQGR